VSLENPTRNQAGLWAAQSAISKAIADCTLAEEARDLLARDLDGLAEGEIKAYRDGVADLVYAFAERSLNEIPAYNDVDIQAVGDEAAAAAQAEWDMAHQLDGD
jgi:hypothetical protein